MTDTSHMLDALRTVTGEDGISDRGGRTVVSVTNTEQVSAVLRFAHQEGVAVEILGAGTKRSWGGNVQANLLLDMTRLAGVIEHSAHDLTASVRAGTPWRTMQSRLEQNRQFVALDPLWPERATAGGIVATNDSGALRLKYGSLRDLVIGMTIVLADGTIAHSGGKVVKNVAGYDMHKLMIGAHGTLGVVTEVTFRLHPMCRDVRTWSIASSSAEELGKAMIRVLDSHLSVQCMQMRSSSSGHVLDVQLASLPKVLEMQAGRLQQMSPAALEEVPTEVFAAREQMFGGGMTLKLTMLPTKAAEMAAEVVSRGGTAVTQATGSMLAQLPLSTSAQALTKLRERLFHGGGSLTVLHGAKDEFGTGIDPQALRMMRAIRQQLDPKDILNPGRMGGIA